MPSTLRAYAVVLPVVILGLVAPAISAAQIETNLTLEVTSVHAQLTNLVVGDRYDLSFTLDDATEDGNASADNGDYPMLVTSWSMTAHPGNAGSWVPSGTAAPDSGDYTSDDALDQLSFEIGGSGYPSGGATASWFGFHALTDWIPGGLVDTGAGEALAEQLGQSFGIPPGEFELRILFTDLRRVAVIDARLSVAETSILEMPTASTVGLMALVALLALVGLRRLS